MNIKNTCVKDKGQNCNKEKKKKKPVTVLVFSQTLITLFYSFFLASVLNLDF